MQQIIYFKKTQIKFIPTLISIGIALLIGYGFFAANGSGSEWQRWLMFGLSAATFIILLGGGFGIRYAERGVGNITALSVVFVIFALIVNVIFTFAPFHAAPYIVIMGILVLLYVGIAYALAKALSSV